MEGFNYQSLQSREFRLLRISSDKGTVLELEHAGLDSAPQYIALSYTWGRAPYRKGRSASAMYKVTVNSFTFPIQENLHDALTHLGSRVRKKKCLLWVDQICINQGDLDERSSQVLHMKHIYEHAHAVYGWLGVPYDAEETRLAVQMMKKINQRLCDGLARNNDDIHAASTDLSDSDEEISPKIGTDRHTAWLGIREMLSQPYWQRAWVYQEATGPAPTYYCCGNSSFDKVYLSASVYMGYHFSKFRNLDFELCQSISHSSAFRLSAFRDLGGEFRGGAGLLKLLYLTRHTQCTDPRDKVYAFRRLADDLTLDDVVPNYSKPVEAVYSDVALFSLSQQRHGLDIFGHAFFPMADSEVLKSTHDGPRIPTWIPDWRDQLTIMPFYKRLNQFNNELILDPDKRSYQAHGPHPMHNAHVEGSSLKLDGCYVDRISRILPTWEKDENHTSYVKSWAPSNGDELYAPTGQTLDLAFRITLVADMQRLGRSRGHAVQWEILEKGDNELGPDEGAQKYDIYLPLYHTCFGRAFRWTINGYMGIVPAASKVDDVVCIFFSGQVPYVLRHASQGHHKLIGECYIHGLMDGEVFDQPDFRSSNLETFVLD